MEIDSALYEPAWPMGCPEEKKEEWRKEFDAAAKRKGSDGASVLRAAMCSANQIVLAVTEPENHESALRLPSWQVLKRSIENNGASRLLRIVTIDGQKFVFLLPTGSDVKFD